MRGKKLAAEKRVDGSRRRRRRKRRNPPKSCGARGRRANRTGKRYQTEKGRERKKGSGGDTESERGRDKGTEKVDIAFSSSWFWPSLLSLSSLLSSFLSTLGGASNVYSNFRSPADRDPGHGDLPRSFICFDAGRGRRRKRAEGERREVPKPLHWLLRRSTAGR